MSEHSPYHQQTYYALALDPIHVGTGGYRLGEVDLTIIREPGTNLPKIPGSSLEGTARAYTAMSVPGKYSRENPETGAQKSKYVSCAGKGGDDGTGHCGEIDCPVCVTYGFTIGPQSRSFHGMAQFYDAQLLFFPVHSMVGPVWVTSPMALAGAGYTDAQIEDDKIRTSPKLVQKQDNQRWGLNLGWLYLDIEADGLKTDNIWKRLNLPAGELDRIKGRLVLVSDKLFSAIVDSNLEVRTSVSIDPTTGAAEDGALFTYEAIPRGTVLHFPVVCHNPQHYTFPKWVKGENDSKDKIVPTSFGDKMTPQWVEAQVVKGLRLMEHLGVGGMNTRGFGRMRVLGLPAVQPQGGE